MPDATVSEADVLMLWRESPHDLLRGGKGSVVLLQWGEGPDVLLHGGGCPDDLLRGRKGPDVLLCGADGPKVLLHGAEGPVVLLRGGDSPDILRHGKGLVLFRLHSRVRYLQGLLNADELIGLARLCNIKNTSFSDKYGVNTKDFSYLSYKIPAYSSTNTFTFE